eukprot:NODE_101_length_19951_cov_0.932501.p5 type:complete len:419 gc:universal NODE_101_length_19951_cov_0.932501:8465-7209(-)
MFFFAVLGLVFKSTQYYKDVNIYGVDLRFWIVPQGCVVISSSNVICANLGTSVFRNGTLRATISLVDKTCVDYSHSFNSTHLVVSLISNEGDVTETLIRHGIRITAKRRNDLKIMNYSQGIYSLELIERIGKWEYVLLSAGRVLYGSCPIRDKLIQLNLRKLFRIFHWNSYFSFLLDNPTSNLDFQSNSLTAYESVFYKKGLNFIKYVSDQEYYLSVPDAIFDLKITSDSLVIQNFQKQCLYFGENTSWTNNCEEFLILDGIIPYYAIVFGDKLFINGDKLNSQNYSLVNIGARSLSVKNSTGYFSIDLNTFSLTQSEEKVLNQITADELIIKSGLIYNEHNLGNVTNNIRFSGRLVYSIDQNLYIGLIDKFYLKRLDIVPGSFFCNLLGYCKFFESGKWIEIDLIEFIANSRYLVFM